MKSANLKRLVNNSIKFDFRIIPLYRILDEEKNNNFERCSSRTPNIVKVRYDMLIDEKKYKIFKKQVEDKLQKYYFYLISLETPGLGQATRWDQVYEKSNHPSDPVSKVVVDDEYKKILVNAIENVYDRLDVKSQEIIKQCYFEDNLERPEEVMKKLGISKNRYYELKKISLYKFMIGLGYC